MAPGSGLRNNLSDIVGRVRVAPGPYFNLTYRFNLDTRSFSFRRQEVTAAGGVPALRLGVTYIDLADQIGQNHHRFHRVLINEITRKAVQEAIARPHKLDRRKLRPRSRGASWIDWWVTRSARFCGRRCGGD